MLLMSDSLTVLGSRIGLAVDPYAKSTYLIRHGRHPGIPMEANAGVRVNGQTFALPIGKSGSAFTFYDQKMTPTSFSITGIDGSTGIKAKITIFIPFRPGDEFFSTIPAIFVKMSVSRIKSAFRWTKHTKEVLTGELFFEAGGEMFQSDPLELTTLTTAAEGYEMTYRSEYFRDHTQLTANKPEYLECRDRIVSANAAAISESGHFAGFHIPFTLAPGETGPEFTLAWCAYDAPVMNVLGDIVPFRYTKYFHSVDDVSSWALANSADVENNSKKVDGILTGHNIGESVSHLMSYTLHSWLSNTWWTLRSDGSDWFAIWEGSCYFHSTLDLEFTVGPFYLTVWPELLEMELDQWPLFVKPGESSIGDAGKNTVFFSHDFGQHAESTGQKYHHEMEVEENTNYILLAFSHWRRTANDRIIAKHSETIKKALDFIIACDTTGNGIPDLGCANTVDDASPALQFGKEQVYLGVKAMAAALCGYEILKHIGDENAVKYKQFAIKARCSVENQGWLGDHYAVSMTRTLDGLKDPWTGEAQKGELAGWDAYHIYTANALAILEMVGFDTGLDRNRIAGDIRTAAEKTMTRYGSSHSSYSEEGGSDLLKEGLASGGSGIGWVSMNMVRDIAGGYYGLDLFALCDKYWDWQLTTNTRDITMFFETFFGNNLHFYPRGILVFAFFDAISGHKFDAVGERESFLPVRGGIKVPILNTANWTDGTVKILRTGNVKPVIL